MKKAHRAHLLRLAGWLDRRAAQLRRIAKAGTPKRAPRAAEIPK